MKDIFILGTGKAAELHCASLDLSVYSVKGFAETKKTKSVFMNLPVFELDSLKDIDWDEIHIANGQLATVLESLKRIGRDKIVLAHFDLLLKYIEYNNGKLDLRFCLFDAVVERQMPYLMKRGGVESKKIFNVGENIINILPNYTRIAMSELLSREIMENDITGDIAVLGVYRGESSNLYNRLFQGRNLLLFDTFEGVNKEQAQKDYDLCFIDRQPGKRDAFGNISFNKNYSDTSVEFVMSQMKYPELCKIYKGFFPATIPEEKHSFAFVEIDVALYEPTLDGLRYFYPNLSKGGYILCVGYNNDNWKGIKKAIQDYEIETGTLLAKVPLSDVGGSIVICK